MPTTHIINKGIYGVLDLFGPTVEFLTLPEEPDAVCCVMIGTIPPSISVPLHSHPVVESFFMVSGTVQVPSHNQENFKWLSAKSGDFVHISGGANIP